MPLDFNALREMIVQDGLSQTLQLLYQHLIAGPAQIRNQVLAMQGRLADHERDVAMGVANNPHTVSELRIGLLNLLDQLENSPSEKQESLTPLFVIVYDAADTEQFKQLSRHLRVLVIAKKLAIYDVHDSRFQAEYLAEARRAISSAPYVIALISNNLFGTEWFDLIEEARSVQKKIIPVMLEPVLGYEEFELVKLRSLPTQKRTVRDFSNADQAFTDIVTEIRKVLN